jgi:uncharacterized protein (TIGR02118 family)
MMRTVFACFDFKSTDLEAEERNYAEVHVALAKQLPGLRQYITGRLHAPSGQQPPHYRAALLSFDSAAEAEAAMRKSPVAKAVAADGREHMTNLRWLEMDSEIIVPFEAKRPGNKYLLMAAEFDLQVEKAGFSDAASAEQRYLGEHTRIARRLPGLRHYMVGRLVEAAHEKPDRLRIAFLVFDDADALKSAYRSPVGIELIKDEEAPIANARVYRIDATVQL